MNRSIARVAAGVLKSVSGSRDDAARPEIADALVATMTAPDVHAWRDLAERLEERGLSMCALVDVYIPLVARRLGIDWCEDRASFATVTLGCARLASLVRWAEARIPESQVPPPLDHGQVCLLCAEGGQHNLGLMVLASQLRRRGVTAVSRPDGRLPETADVVMISATGHEDLTTLQQTIARIRGLDPSPRILLGGAAVANAPDLCAAAGADAVTVDLDVAVRHCLRDPDGVDGTVR